MFHTSVSAASSVLVVPLTIISTTSSNAASTRLCAVASPAVAVLASPFAKLIAATVSVC